jgi:hypothetical protein
MTLIKTILVRLLSNLHITNKLWRDAQTARAAYSKR